MGVSDKVFFGQFARNNYLCAAKNRPMQQIIIYTDGAASGNPGPGGYGVVLTCGPHRKELSEGFRHQVAVLGGVLHLILAQAGLAHDYAYVFLVHNYQDCFVKIQLFFHIFAYRASKRRFAEVVIPWRTRFGIS